MHIKTTNAKFSGFEMSKAQEQADIQRAAEEAAFFNATMLSEDKAIWFGCLCEKAWASHEGG